MDTTNLKFYIVVNKERKGPYSIDQLKTLGITPKTKVWYKGLSNWVNAETIPALKELFPDNSQPNINESATPAPKEPVESTPIQSQENQEEEESKSSSSPINTTKKGNIINTKLLTIIFFLALIIITSIIIVINLSNDDIDETETTLDIQSEEEIIPQNPIERLEYEMVTIDGGTLILGATSEQSAYAMNQEYPAHEVTLSSYKIGRYEVTQEQWEAIMGYNPSYNIGAKKPVENVSWNECQSFLNKLNVQTGKNYRLPTEAEWEFAARGGNQSHYYIYSGSNNADAVAWHKGNSNGTTHEVGTKQANELGLFDMSGNVFEWCNDKYGYYSYGPEYNPQGNGTSSKIRVGHGGGYNLGTKFCRVSNRTQGTTNYKSESLGFRIAHD